MRLKTVFVAIMSMLLLASNAVGITALDATKPAQSELATKLGTYERETRAKVNEIIAATPGFVDFLVKTGDYTAVNGDKLAVDTTSLAITITLPATPTAGNYILIYDAKNTWSAHNITLGRNGSNIRGSAADLTFASGPALGLVYVDASYGWGVMQYGSTGNPTLNGYVFLSDISGHSLATAASTYASDNLTILVDVAASLSDVTYGSTLTIPANLSIEVSRSGSIAIPNGRTLSIAGAFSAFPRTVFYCTGSGNVVFSGNTAEVLPEWWGSTNDYSADDSAAVTAAYGSLVTYGGKMRLSNKPWRFNLVAYSTGPGIEIVGGGKYGYCWVPNSDASPVVTVGAVGATYRVYGLSMHDFHMCSLPVGATSGFTSSTGLWMKNGSYNKFSDFWISNFIDYGIKIIDDGDIGVVASSANVYENFVVGVGANSGGSSYAIYNGVGTGSTWSTSSYFHNFVLWAPAYGNTGSLIYNPQESYSNGFLELDSNATNPYYAIHFPASSTSGGATFYSLDIETARAGANTAVFIRNDYTNTGDYYWTMGTIRSLGGLYQDSDGNTYGIGYGNSQRSYNNPTTTASDIRTGKLAVGGIIGLFADNNETEPNGADPYNSWTRHIRAGAQSGNAELQIVNRIGPVWILNHSTDGTYFYEYDTSDLNAIINGTGIFTGGTGGVRTYIQGSDTGGNINFTGYTPGGGTSYVGSMHASTTDNATEILATLTGGKVLSRSTRGVEAWTRVGGTETKVGGWDNATIIIQTQTKTPTSSTEACTKGALAWSDNGTTTFMYLCYATNKWTLISADAHNFR